MPNKALIRSPTEIRSARLKHWTAVQHWMYDQVAIGAIDGTLHRSPQALAVSPSMGTEIAPRDSQALRALCVLWPYSARSRGRKWGRSEGNRYQARFAHRATTRM